MSRYAPSLTNARNSPRSSIVPSQQITKQNTMFLDSGRKSLFTAVVGVASAKQIRKSSVKEYYHLTGSTVYSKKLELKKECSGIKTIESQIPTPKTAAVGSYDQYVKYTLTHLDKLLDFYGKDTAHRRF
ncbi:hypothetical protein G6F58_012175 [Rhizopus delemar]|nr:hypothetical protein G6F58_012175 [Rhizopus delemar]